MGAKISTLWREVWLRNNSCIWEVLLRQSSNGCPDPLMSSLLARQGSTMALLRSLSYALHLLQLFCRGISAYMDTSVRRRSCCSHSFQAVTISHLATANKRCAMP